MTPQPVRTIVCAYTRDELPTSWIQVFRRFEQAVARAELRIRVKLLPLEDLPGESFDVLVVHPRLAQRARHLVGGALLIVTAREGAHEVVDALLEKIAAGETLAAERIDPAAPKVVRRRGSEVL